MDVMLTVIFFVLLFYTRGEAYLQLVEPRNTTVSISSTYSDYSASRAVDGNFDQHSSNCSHTNSISGITEAWLRVDLKEAYSIKSVKFYYRSNEPGTKRLSGYSIRVSNDTSLPPPGSSCYTDPGNVTLPTIIKKDCERTARYVWFYQDKGNVWIYQDKGHKKEVPMLEICEIQVFGCKPGRYGENCTKTCNHCKNKAYCGIVHGRCDAEGCGLPGFQTPYCQACIVGKYGEECSETCSKFCQSRNCDRKTGACNDGCLAGYTGSLCEQMCEFGKYGQNCSETCGKCFENTCNHINGTCADGCAAGFMTNLCKTRCKDGRYGRDCQFNCSGNCLNQEICDKQNGTCESCAEGYQGGKCDERCETGSYGLNCTKNCAACLHDTDCHHVTGMCSSGCKKGWKDVEKCDKGCVDGRYGNDCAKNCSKLCKYQTCEQTKGVCLHGCLEGYTGWECSEPQDLSDPTNNYQPILYGVVMCTSLVFNIVSVILMVRHGVCQRKRGNQSTTEETAVPPIIYDAVEDNNEYQELGQLSESSHYTELQKI
uniref:Multiple epidermal growth factor-like domains protein 10 isoform X2 n=1 Tax=Crassostrea virginica TaxID=6565 RepID=A0A8B8CBI1_CRAVI|nr:multiple epidermal growth factor-like domains protein 10 isoform X2 [Crassostrea virginica]